MADKLLKSIKFPTLPDRYVIGDSTLTEEGAAAEAKAVGEALATKADTKGTYEDLIVGGAEQLMADGYETDKEPYLFRTTGGSADVGNREYLDKIVGGTVAWNQLANNDQAPTSRNGVTFERHDDYFTMDGTATSHLSASGWFGLTSEVSKRLSGHKVLVDFQLISGTVSDTTFVEFHVNGRATSRLTLGTRKVIQCDASTNHSELDISSGIVLTNVKARLQIIDLTAMFGTTIADYIYSLEQSQAGAGVAWFRNYFQKDYYPYDPGTLRSVEGVSAHETVGKNLLDNNGLSDYTTWESLGSYNYAKPLNLPKDTQVTVSGQHTVPSGMNPYVYMQRFDGTDWQNFKVLWQANASNMPYTFTTDDASYRLWAYNPTASVATIDWMQIELGTTATAYEPYVKHTYPLDNSLTLRGTPKLVDGKLEFDGDIYPPSGEVQRRYGIVDLGTLDWEYDSGLVRFFATAPSNTPESIPRGLEDVICGKYWNACGKQVAFNNNEIDKCFLFRSSFIGGARIYIRDTTYTSVADFKTAVTGTVMVYPLATPTTETADGYEHYQTCDPSGTEEFVTDSIVPVGHETRYPHDLKKKIETAPDSPSTDGTYLMKRSGGKNTYMALPSTPSANGAYVLTVTVSGGSASYSWAAKE